MPDRLVGIIVVEGNFSVAHAHFAPGGLTLADLERAEDALRRSPIIGSEEAANRLRAALGVIDKEEP